MTYTLTATSRTAKGSLTRRNGQIPGTVYGGTEQAHSIAVDYNQFSALYEAAGEASLIDCLIDNAAGGKVLIQDVQHDPVSGRIIHLDLRRIDMSKPITALVELKVVGEAPIIKESGGTLMTTISQVTVQCLPQDLVAQLEVDISALKAYTDSIKVENLALPAGVAIVSHQPGDLVAKAQAALTEEQIKAMEAAGPATVADIESAKPVKPEEGEEAKEGAAAPEAKKEEKKDEKK